MNYFYNDDSKELYKSFREMFNDNPSMDDTLLVTYCNLQIQENELQVRVSNEGYSVTNVNSRGGETHQINPTYRAYLACVAEKNKIHSKIIKISGNLGETSDGFDQF